MRDSNKEIIRFSLSFPGELYQEMMTNLGDRQYQSRSEYFRDLFRGSRTHDEWRSPNREVVGVLSIVYNHHQRGLSEKINAIQHDSKAHVQCTTHVHLQHELCLENTVIVGKSADVTALANQISALKGVEQAQLIQHQNR
ncbi:nickel-responsive transcriptional regulator NikR [Photobacterium sp. DA100]|uniref:nickel-responsive transcriptional regulator NikR n=1 Tax=Photobacterium sp. DA100 TaxID=3027472 RepID=UPI002479B57B|nr:nickel-responsive transcriptional regulator NikR [Photobacterium sp. DA100]WEM41191.1 nickel-responsive transcriptional regulator NikR [Photobacterium sp. DA100]